MAKVAFPGCRYKDSQGTLYELEAYLKNSITTLQASLLGVVHLFRSTAQEATTQEGRTGGPEPPSLIPTWSSVSLPVQWSSIVNSLQMLWVPCRFEWSGHTRDLPRAYQVRVLT